MFSCWLTFHCELRPSDILHVLIWPSEQFEFETLGLRFVLIVFNFMNVALGNFNVFISDKRA